MQACLDDEQSRFSPLRFAAPTALAHYRYIRQYHVVGKRVFGGVLSVSITMWTVVLHDILL